MKAGKVSSRVVAATICAALEERKTLSAASKTSWYESLLKGMLLICAKTFTGSFMDHMAKAAPEQQQPSSFTDFLQMSAMICAPNCDGNPVIVLPRDFLYESWGFGA